jgi:hypothetical protein
MAINFHHNLNSLNVILELSSSIFLNSQVLYSKFITYVLIYTILYLFTLKSPKQLDVLSAERVGNGEVRRHVHYDLASSKK